MNRLKNAIVYEEETAAPGSKMPLDQFNEIRNHPDHSILNQKLKPLDREFNDEISGGEGLVDLNSFSNLVDLYTYMPKKLNSV